MPYKVFISHSSRDTWVAEQIETHVQMVGANTFLDERNIHFGDDFESVIFNELKTVDELLVLITPWALERPYIWSEIAVARFREIRVIPVLYGVSINDLADKPVISRTDLVEINDLNIYFGQLKNRVSTKMI